jgi:hypothetical protein
MNERTKTGLEIIQVAIAIGVIGDIFLRVTPWGLNVLVFNAAFVAGMIMLLRRRAPEYLTRQTYALFGSLIFFASMFVWRDSIELRVADTFAILAVLSVLFLPQMKVTTQIAGVFHYIVGFVWSCLSAVGAPFLLIFSDVEWGGIPRDGWRRHAFSAARGAAIAAPLILIFGGLFVAADAAYEGLVQRVFNIRPEIVFTHVFLFAVFSWMTAGYLRGVLTKPAGTIVDAPISVTETARSNESKFENVRAESGEYPVTLPNHLSVTEHINISDPPNQAETSPVGSVPFETDNPTTDRTPSENKPSWSWANFDNSVLPATFTLGTVEVCVILGLMNLLFLSFVIVQVPYLFGGMEMVQNTPDFKLAEYARRGFGELVAVSALVLPTLLIGHWLIRKQDRLAGTIFRVLAGAQIVLLFVIMASAVQRLVLLTGSFGYGMTTIRLYPMIFMTWLAIVFVWFGATVLRGARQYFAWGALWSAFLVLGATHVLNPDAFIVKTNIVLMEHGREFDAKYNASLSDDALPVLMDSFADLKSDDQKEVLMRIGERYCDKQAGSDLRSWNYSRWLASGVLNEHQKTFMTFGQCDGDRYLYPRYDDLH